MRPVTLSPGSKPEGIRRDGKSGSGLRGIEPHSHALETCASPQCFKPIEHCFHRAIYIPTFGGPAGNRTPLPCLRDTRIATMLQTHRRIAIANLSAFHNPKSAIRWA
jgi:hypothetical protein